MIYVLTLNGKPHLCWSDLQHWEDWKALARRLAPQYGAKIVSDNVDSMTIHGHVRVFEYELTPCNLVQE
jgi:hypothetical protein